MSQGGAKSDRHIDTPLPYRWGHFKPPSWGQFRLSRPTGFTVEGEIVLKVFDKLTSDGVDLVVDAVTKAEADYSSPMHPFDDYSITAGRVITGANPASARSAAERAVTAFDELPGVAPTS